MLSIAMHLPVKYVLYAERWSAASRRSRRSCGAAQQPLWRAPRQPRSARRRSERLACAAHAAGTVGDVRQAAEEWQTARCMCVFVRVWELLSRSSSMGGTFGRGALRGTDGLNKESQPASYGEVAFRRPPLQVCWVCGLSSQLICSRLFGACAETASYSLLCVFSN